MGFARDEQNRTDDKDDGCDLQRSDQRKKESDRRRTDRILQSDGEKPGSIHEQSLGGENNV